MEKISHQALAFLWMRQEWRVSAIIHDANLKPGIQCTKVLSHPNRYQWVLVSKDYQYRAAQTGKSFPVILLGQGSQTNSQCFRGGRIWRIQYRAELACDGSYMGRAGARTQGREPGQRFRRILR
jgi:hypothetical protein